MQDESVSSVYLGLCNQISYQSDLYKQFGLVHGDCSLDHGFALKNCRLNLGFESSGIGLGFPGCGVGYQGCSHGSDLAGTFNEIATFSDVIGHRNTTQLYAHKAITEEYHKKADVICAEIMLEVRCDMIKIPGNKNGNECYLCGKAETTNAVGQGTGFKTSDKFQ